MAIREEALVALRANAYNRTLTSYAIAIFGMIGTAWLIVAYGIEGPVPVKVALLSLALFVAIFTGLALPAVWSELAGLRLDKPDGFIGTAYEAAVDKQQYGVFGALSVLAAVVFAAMAAWVLFG